MEIDEYVYDPVYIRRQMSSLLLHADSWKHNYTTSMNQVQLYIQLVQLQFGCQTFAVRSLQSAHTPNTDCISLISSVLRYSISQTISGGRIANSPKQIIVRDAHTFRHPFDDVVRQGFRERQATVFG